MSPYNFKVAYYVGILDSVLRTSLAGLRSTMTALIYANQIGRNVWLSPICLNLEYIIISFIINGAASSPGDVTGPRC